MTDHEIWQLIGRIVFGVLALIALLDMLLRRRR